MPSAFPYRLLLATALLLSFLVDGFHAANNPTAPATPTSTMMASQLRRAASSSAEISLAGEAAVALESFITGGPLFGRCCAAKPAVDVGEWQENGAFLQTDVLHIPGDKTLTRAEATRIYQYYLPVHYWIDGLLEAHRSASAAASSEGANAPPLFVGISCPQGGGKTTIVDSIAALFKRQGKSCAEVSIDDFYLTHADQQKVAAENPGNSLLQLRGNPGSHDMKLALDTLKELADANGKSGGGGGSVSVPRYDKSAFSGKGDRADPSTWPSLATPVDVVLMEGWCFGFKSLPATPGPSDERLALSNELLAGDYRSMHELMAAWVVVEVESPQVVYNWREQAEAAMRAAGKTAMTKEQVADFVDRYMPAYSHYLPSLYADGPDGAEGKPVLSFQIDNGRNPVSVADAVPFHFD